MSAPSIVLVSDRSLMSNFRGNYIMGFLSCAPTTRVPNFVYDWLFAPPVDAHSDGRATVAPMGLRRIESALLAADEYGPTDVAVAHPSHIESVVGPDTEVIGVNAMDPLGMGPVTSSFGSGSSADLTPMNAVKFRKLLESIHGMDFDGQLVAGGAGSWQLNNENIAMNSTSTTSFRVRQATVPRRSSTKSATRQRMRPSFVKVPTRSTRYPRSALRRSTGLSR